MRSAYRSNREVIAYIAVLTASLMLPVILLVIGPAPRQDVYRVNEESGPMASMGREIYERHEPIDFLFFGASIIRAAIVPGLIERELRVETGKNLVTVVCGPNWQGLDTQYVILHDFLTHRRVKYLFLNLPASSGVAWSNKPHIALYRMLRLGDIPGFTSGLSPVHRAQVYAAEILGAPRQLLSLARPDLAGEDEVTLLDRSRQTPGPLIGYHGAAPVSDNRQPPLLPGEKMIYDESSDAGWFRFSGEPPGDYQLNMLAKIAALASEHGTRIVVLNIPIDADKGNPFVVERMDWSKLLATHVTLVGIPAAVLFQQVSGGDFYHFYVDQHLNLNGRRYFTKAIIPALKRLLENGDGTK